MRLAKKDITNFMVGLGMVQDQVSQIHNRAQLSWNYTEELLGALFPANVLLPSSHEYSASISQYFGTRARLNASAVFVPDCTAQVAVGVKIMETFGQQFAIRGNGYTSHPGMAGIAGGVLFSLDRMDEITITPSRQIVRIGAGNQWGDVYEALESEGLAVAGGQLAPVGVSGLLTGNGLSHFLSSRGFSSADVANFEVVLAGGKIVNANAKENEDLWWALKGGANNFGIVTRFDMNTFSLPNGVWSGVLSYDPSQAAAIGEAFYDIQIGALNEQPHIDVFYSEMSIPGYNVSAVDLVTFTDKVNFTGEYPTALQPLYDARPVSVSASRKTLTVAATQDVTPEFLAVYTKRIDRANLQVKASKGLYKELAGLLSAHYASSSISGHTLMVTWNSVTPHAIRESNRKGGNPGGWQEINQNSINFRSNWDNAADDAAAIAMDREFMAKLQEVAMHFILKTTCLISVSASEPTSIFIAMRTYNIEGITSDTTSAITY
ncbi:mitomycin radical oxidase [Stemphylium lycopersici]|nr:mitomycin radical oxidase [Stemphylium lycopersici]